MIENDKNFKGDDFMLKPNVVKYLNGAGNVVVIVFMVLGGILAMWAVIAGGIAIGNDGVGIGFLLIFPIAPTLFLFNLFLGKLFSVMLFWKAEMLENFRILNGLNNNETCVDKINNNLLSTKPQLLNGERECRCGVINKPTEDKCPECGRVQNAII